LRREFCGGRQGLGSVVKCQKSAGQDMNIYENADRN
jgi:hypothetical protein